MSLNKIKFAGKSDLVGGIPLLASGYWSQ